MERSGKVAVDFEHEHAYAISVLRVMPDVDKYRMRYSWRGKSYRIEYAESTDGYEWIKKDDEAGIDVSRSGWDSERICYPFIFDHMKNCFKFYNGNGYGKTGFGLAVLLES